MQALIGPIASGIISALVATVGVYVAMTNRLTRLETLMEQLKDEVEKHNAMVERTYRLESDSAALTARVERLEQKP